jgi:hypothetical protein
MRRIYRILFVIVGAVGLACVALVTLVMVTWGGPKDRLVAQSLSPDKRTIAEIHEEITGMWGGPDTIYVSLMGQKVYVRVYGCDDSSGYTLHWESPHKLTVTYSACRPYPSRPGDYSVAESDPVQQMLRSWNDIEIGYKDSGHVATQ